MLPSAEYFQSPGLPAGLVRQDSVPARPECFQSSLTAGLGPDAHERKSFIWYFFFPARTLLMKEKLKGFL